MTMTHAIHEDHLHEHGPDCGHASVVHDDHVDYFHDGHTHRLHDGHWDECEGAHAAQAITTITSTAPTAVTRPSRTAITSTTCTTAIATPSTRVTGTSTDRHGRPATPAAGRPHRSGPHRPGPRHRPGHESASCTRIAIWTRFVMSSLVSSRETCALTVASLMNSRPAISAFDAPDATASATSRSRSVSEPGARWPVGDDPTSRRCPGG